MSKIEAQVHILVLRDESVVNDSRYHNMTAVAHALAYNGLQVALGSTSMYAEGMKPEGILKNFAVSCKPCATCRIQSSSCMSSTNLAAMHACSYKLCTATPAIFELTLYVRFMYALFLI